MKILLTGGNGFIGRRVLGDLSSRHDITVADLFFDSIGGKKFKKQELDFRHPEINKKIFNNKFDLIIHCAGIAHQKFGSIDLDEYFRVNSHSTEYIAKAAAFSNPDVHLIFLSSISVYGEDFNNTPRLENTPCHPTSDYAISKLDAEKRLQKLYDSGQIKRIDILRLAPVFDSSWSLNLDRRVLALKKTAYIRFGNGDQMMSAVSRQNVVDFIDFLVNNREQFSERYCHTYNVCDERPYSFNKIIETFKRSPHHPDRMVVSVPLSFVWVLTRLAGLTFRDKRQWLHSCYDKLAHDLVFENSRMLATGFRPKETLESVFLSPQITAD